MSTAINISVIGKIATQTNDAVYICDNSDYNIVFTFDDEWASHATKTARFIREDGTYTETAFNGNTVAVPILTNMYYFYVGVYAGNLITTTPARIACKKSIYGASGSHVAPSTDVYNQIIALLNGFNASVTKTGDTATITITDPEGTTTASITDGEDGEDGEDGYSPTITVTDITGGHRLTITDKNGTRTVDVMDGSKGDQGDPGEGVPSGGTAGQILSKKSGTNYDTEWVDPESGTTDFDDLSNRPSYNGSAMTHSTNIPEVKTDLWDSKASGNHNHDSRYYTESETDTLLSAKESTANKVTSMSSESTDTEYPSAKAVYDAIPDEAQDIYFDNNIKGLLNVTDVQSAIDELSEDVDSHSSQIAQKISNPSTKSNGQVLTFNGTDWYAATPQSGASIDDTTTASDKVWSSSKTNTEISAKSTVSVSSTGTATDEIGYITVDGVEKKLPSGGGGTSTPLYAHIVTLSVDYLQISFLVISTDGTQITINNIVDKYYGKKFLGSGAFKYSGVFYAVSTVTVSSTTLNFYGSGTASAGSAGRKYTISEISNMSDVVTQIM